MIVTQLMGGLGNQMFQYAFGKSLSLRTGSPLAVDLSFLNQNQVSQGSYIATQYALEGFPGIRDRQIEIEPSPLPRRVRPLWRRLRHPRLRVVRETSLAFDASLLELRPPVFLHGYWQSEEYFAEHADAIRAAFTFPALVDDAPNQRVLDAIQAASCSIAVHVRRGDYLHPHIAKFIGLCSPTYYERAFRVMAERYAGATYFFFSDDPEWVRAALAPAVDSSVVVDGNAEDPMRDLFLMSACTHHVIANSSFSWWGAWLGGGPTPAGRAHRQQAQTVIAPARWYVDADLAEQARDNCPARWLRLSDQ